MTTIINGTSSAITFPDSSVQNTAGLVAGGTIATGTVTTLTSTTLSDGTNSTSSTNAIQGSAKAWVNYKGTSTQSIRASYNVSSVTVNGTGDYTINFTTALVDANYAICGAQGDTGAPNGAGMFVTNRIGSTGAVSAPTASACRVNTTNSSGNVLDNTYVYVAVFR